MSQFEELLAQLQSQADEHETMAKALPAEDGEDDEAIQAAADDGAEGDESDEEDEADEGEEGEEDDGEEGRPFGKSMTAVVDGEEVEAIDATELIKSLMGRLDSQEGALTKALETTLGTIKSQGEMIKSLSARLEKISSQGRGRKAVLSIVDKPVPGEQTLAKSETAILPGEVMAKAMSAHQGGKITAQDVARCEISFQSGYAFPADVLAKI